MIRYMKIVYYWVQMRFARRAWLESHNSEMRYHRNIHLKGDRIATIERSTEAMKDMHYYQQALNKAKKGQ